jgi:hypothetical protein
MQIPPDRPPLTTVAITSTEPGAQHLHVYVCSGLTFALLRETESGSCAVRSTLQQAARSCNHAPPANHPASQRSPRPIQIP